MQLEDTEPDLFREKNACRRSVGAEEQSSETESLGSGQATPATRCESFFLQICCTVDG